MGAIKLLCISFLIFFTSINKAQNDIKPLDYDALTQKYFKEGIDTFLVLQKDTFWLKDLRNYLHSSEKHLHFDEYSVNEKSKLEWWLYFLNRIHPSVSTLEKYFQGAANEFNVPLHLLHSIAMVENNWTHIGPSIDRGWGMMHLVENNYVNTLGEASSLLNISKEAIKKDPFQNIRACAALLADYAGSKRHSFSNYEQWYPALRKYSALIDASTRQLQLEAYLKVLYEGRNSKTIWGEEIILKPQDKQYK